ncbi:PREDICTED: uncharacterized protein LOC104586473 [Nelumbo nucifera]|uniref:Uncharacterized protein LOC104586473 n=1 Tax=Nelumbo nucifera TaxID=4432 RepID=A0A1U7YSJ7_NELNU|nr:PREDICTED: uncharacterized protein LOC104586473 [Nelumbo nucifera]
MDYNDQKGCPTDMNSSGPPYLPKYAILPAGNGDGDQVDVRPPSYRRNIPRYLSTQNRKSGSICLQCICCCYCILLLLIVILASLTVYLYTFFEPKMPSYTVERFGVNSFDLQPDFKLYIEFLVSLKVENPNDKIGIIYGKDNLVVVAHQGLTLGTGKIPAFFQRYKNVTFMEVVVKGKSELGSAFQATLMENRLGMRIPIPLNMNIKVPMNFMLGESTLRQFTFLVNCSFAVDNLSPKHKVDILSSNYNVSFAL